jgi:hypothetical protein
MHIIRGGACRGAVLNVRVQFTRQTLERLRVWSSWNDPTKDLHPQGQNLH